MEYSGDAFYTFMDLDSAIYLAVNGTVTSRDRPIYRFTDIFPDI